MEVKVDPGSETNCIPLSHFRWLFPQLCRSDGLPKETALEPTLAQFEAYNGGVMRAHGWIVVSTQNISDNKFHPVRYYVVEREEARILISHATATWLGLVKVLCTNKAPKCKRQVASVTRKTENPVKNNSDFRTTTPSRREIFSERTTTPSQRKIFFSDDSTAKSPTSKSHSRGRKQSKREEGHEEHQPVKRQDQVTNSLPSGRDQSCHSALLAGPAHPPKEKYSLYCNNNNNHFEASHFRTTTPSQREISTKMPNVCTTSHRKTKKLTRSTLRAISSPTKTPRR